MIKSKIKDGVKVIIVTHPTQDKIFACGILTAMFLLLGWYFQSAEVSSGATAGLLSLAALFLLLAVSIQTTKIAVSRTKIEDRRLRLASRTLAVPSGVVVEQRGLLLCIRSGDGDFEFVFPKYLSHHGKLKEAIDDLFST